MKTEIFRNRLFGAIADEFPESAVMFMSPMKFIVTQVFDGRSLSLPITASMNEAGVKNPDILIGLYVKAARQSWNNALAEQGKHV